VQALLVKYSRELLDGIAYLHSQRVLHRDVKPSNILISSEGSVKIIDFDTATYVMAKAPSSRVGTPWYTAPDVIEGEGYSFPVDVWSVGCCILEMSTGSRPYPTANAVQV
jgi:serine/threonine protein kinase